MIGRKKRSKALAASTRTSVCETNVQNVKWHFFTVDVYLQYTYNLHLGLLQANWQYCRYGTKIIRAIIVGFKIATIFFTLGTVS